MKLIKMVSIGILLFCVAINQSIAQDTIRVSEKEINTKVLREGTHRYLVYFKMKKDAPRTQTQFWTRTIERTTQNCVWQIGVLETMSNYSLEKLKSPNLRSIASESKEI